MKLRVKTYCLIGLLLNLLLSISCVSLRGSEGEVAPALTDDMTTSEVLNIAFRFGGDSLKAANKRFSEKKEWAKVQSLSAKLLIDPPSDIVSRQMLQLVSIYQTSITKLDLNVFRSLVRAKDPVYRQAAWHLAANFPSPEIAREMDVLLTEIISSGTESENFFVQLANAARSNKQKSSYTFLRQGLMTTGEDAFAKAMATLDPTAATNDFMDYLSLANPEELRQITQKTVNVYSCIFILKHLLAYPVNGSHPQFNQLFYYSISRNNALSDLGRDVLQYGINASPSQVALLLSREPSWVQTSFVEGVRRTQQPRLKLIVAELMPLASDDAVSQEIREVLR